jgi:hypothetical protein
MRIGLLAFGCLTVLACETDLPGDVVGAYVVRMQLADNSCGAGVVLDEDRYTAELRAGQPPRGFWRVPRFPPLEGRYEDGGFRFTFAEVRELGSADAGTSGCTVFREELLEGTVVRPLPAAERDAAEGDGGDAGLVTATDNAARDDAGPSQPPLRGQHRISFRTNPEGRCRDHMGPLGPFERLPCSARYELTGEATKRF